MRFLLIFFPFLLFSQNLIIKFINLKPYYYKNQIINLKFKVISPFTDLNFTSLNTEINITKQNPYIFLVNSIFKADNKPKKIFITSKEINQTIDLNQTVHIKQLPKTANFCNVLAQNLSVKDPIATLSHNKIFLSFTIKCNMCNLKDFHLNNDENLTLLNNNEATYLVTLPQNTKKFSFYYFNTKKEGFEKIEVPIKLKEDTISTQTNINPNDINFFTPVNILILIIIAIFLIIFLIYQRIWILIFPIILSALLIYQFLPKGKITLKKGDKLTILPTYNSTVIYIIKKRQKVDILAKSRNYVEVKINNKIGWVNENN